MTPAALTTGVRPSALAPRKSSDFSQAMAVAVIGGLITSTLPALLLTPTVYEMVDDFEQWLRARCLRRRTPTFLSGDAP